MDNNWIHASIWSAEYQNGVKEFVKILVERAHNQSRIICPCLRCCHGKGVNEEILLDHLLCNGIDKSKSFWSKFGVNNKNRDPNLRNTMRTEFEELSKDSCDTDRFEEMVDMIERDFEDCPDMFESLKIDAEKPLYGGCAKFTKLAAVLKLYNMKANNGWSDKSFTDLLTLLKEMLPSDNVLPSRTYEAKQMLCSIGMSYERIHACPNDCILYRKEYASLVACPQCNTSRYKKDKSKAAAKVVWYFPIIPRFRRMFGSAEDAKLLVWHEEERIRDGKLRHPADSPQWVKIDHEYPDFAEDGRNLRIALATDGMNPHGTQSTAYSTWPVILMIYNLPPWLCMKRKYMMLTMLISGPKQPENDIDVYLTPLIDDLKFLWNEGVDVYDGYGEESFRLRVMLCGTINDFPAYGNLSGYSIKGQPACPVCEDNTSWIRLKHGSKNVFLGHRRFLPIQHRYRSWRKAFDGSSEVRRAPVPLTGSQLFDKLQNMNIKFGKGYSKDLPTSGWKKKSIFFELPYWKSLYVRHYLDVMHIEKNVFDSVIGTLLNMPGKSKDGIKARLDLREMGLRKELAPVKKGQRTYLPPAAFTLSRKEKIDLCQCLDGVKVPEGYCSNLKNLVSLKDLKLLGLKSHDCHIIMQDLLPVALRSILPTKVRGTLIRLCLFFKSICSKVIDPSKLPLLQKDIILVLCELEMYFPPSFFDIMVHLVVHLVREVQMCGPVHMRWMYPIERYMKILKGYVKNRSRPEGCMVERYIVEEAMEFCTGYLSNSKTIGLPKSRYVGRTAGEGVLGKTMLLMAPRELEQAHLYILHNTDEVESYVEEHLNLIRRLHPGKNENLIAKEHNQTFIGWLRNHIVVKMETSPGSVSERIRWLSSGPSSHAFSYNSYMINGHTFYTREQDDRSTVQNSGVTLVAQAMHISSSKDKNPIYANMAYYGVIEQILELDYCKFRVPVFHCKWADNNSGVRVDEFGFTLVDLNKPAHTSEPFILASQARQVFYISDPSDKKWSTVVSYNKFHNDDHYEDNNDDSDHNNEAMFIDSMSLLENEEIDESDDNDFYVREDHREGIWITPSTRRLRETQKKGTSQMSLRKRKRKSEE